MKGGPVPLSRGFTSSDILGYAIKLRRRPAIAYSIMIGAIALATLVRGLVDGQVVAGPFVTYYPVIIIAALVAGFWTGVLGIICSAALGWYAFLSVASASAPESLSSTSLLLFIGLALLDVAIAAIVNKAVIRLIEQESNVRSLIEALPNGVIRINQQGLIENVNAAVERIFGYARSELVGQSVSILVPDRFRARHEKAFAAYLKVPQPRGLGPDREFRGKRKDGSEIAIEVGLTPIQRYGEAAVVATVIDISRRVRAQKHEKLLVRELQHRTQNLFSVIQAIVNRTMSLEQSVQSARHQLLGRLQALAGAHSMLIASSWEGAPLSDILQREVGGIAPMAITVMGCELTVNASAAQQFALIFHELATNAFKHGALSQPAGRITVAGLVTDAAGSKQFDLAWTEQGGPPVVEPLRRGFGSSVLFEAAQHFGMSVSADFRPEGLVYRLSVALEDIEPVVAHLVPTGTPLVIPATLPP